MISLKIPFQSIVLVRVDYNLPDKTLPVTVVTDENTNNSNVFTPNAEVSTGENKEITTNHRIAVTKKLILELLNEGCKVVLITHLGRPEGFDQLLSTKTLIGSIENDLGRECQYINQYLGFKLGKEEISASKCNLFVLENTRFATQETSNDVVVLNDWAMEYSTLGSYFVDEAFAVSHRKESTNFYLKKYLPWSYGYRYLIETNNLQKVFYGTRPILAIMGGSKLETKLKLIRKILDRCDKLIITGMLSYTFIAAGIEQGMDLPPLFDSKVDNTFLAEAKDLLLRFKDKIILPKDLIYGFDEANKKVCAYDTGFITNELVASEVLKYKTIFYNGPCGDIDNPLYKQGTTHLINKLMTLRDTFVIIGGGDTVGMIDYENYDKFDFISTGGGASLDYLSDL